MLSGTPETRPGQQTGPTPIVTRGVPVMNYERTVLHADDDPQMTPLMAQRLDSLATR